MNQESTIRENSRIVPTLLSIRTYRQTVVCFVLVYLYLMIDRITKIANHESTFFRLRAPKIKNPTIQIPRQFSKTADK